MKRQAKNPPLQIGARMKGYQVWQVQKQAAKKLPSLTKQNTAQASTL
jgi:hypothetical protein